MARDDTTPQLRNGPIRGLESLALSAFSGQKPEQTGLLSVKPLVSTGSYTRQLPMLVDLEAADAATSADAAAQFSVLTQPYRSILLANFSNALLAGQGAVVTARDALIAETVLEYTAQNALPDGFSKIAENRFEMPARIDRVIAQPCLLAQRPWFFNYGHWLIEGAATIALAANLIQHQNLTIIVGENTEPMRRIVHDTIEKIAPGATILEHPTQEIWQVEQLALLSPTHVPPLFKLPAALTRLRQYLAPSAASGRRRLFVSRENTAHRRLVNETEIFALCAEFGCQFILPEALNFTDQIALFAEAELIIGAKGAGLANCLFSPPQSHLIVLSPADFPDPFFWDLVSPFGIHYFEIFGRIVTATHKGANDFTINPEKLRALLQALNLT